MECTCIVHGMSIKNLISILEVGLQNRQNLFFPPLCIVDSRTWDTYTFLSFQISYDKTTRMCSISSKAKYDFGLIKFDSEKCRIRDLFLNGLCDCTYGSSARVINDNVKNVDYN